MFMYGAPWPTDGIFIFRYRFASYQSYVGVRSVMTSMSYASVSLCGVFPRHFSEQQDICGVEQFVQDCRYSLCFRGIVERFGCPFDFLLHCILICFHSVVFFTDFTIE